MFQALLVICLLFVPGAIPIYCIITFMDGFVDASHGKIEHHTEANKRYQVYSLYRYGVRFYHWMTQRVK